MRERRCPACNSPLQIAGSRFISDEGSTDVYQELALVCANPKCNNFCGRDLNDPKTVVETVRNKVN